MRRNPTILAVTGLGAAPGFGFRFLSGLVALALIVLGPEPLTQASAAEELRIGPGDVVNVVVAGRTDLTGKYTVGADGQLFLPLVGGVDAKGKTARELSADLSRRLSVFDRDITRVDVSIAQSLSLNILVLGAVTRPGKYAFAKLPNIWEAIGEAGGPVEDAVLSAVEIIPGDPSSGRGVVVVNVESALREGRLDQLSQVKPGDTIRVPRQSSTSVALTPNTVFVFGAVVRPGMLNLERGGDLIGALARSGGPSPDASLSNIEIVRKSGAQTIPLKANLREYLGKGNTSGNPLLRPGDAIFVPHIRPGGSGWANAVRTIMPLATLAVSIVAISRR
ncbi:MAG: hypothetical protein E6K76_00050 [Candidatus Eisenbacteria bacterium]|uniref:Soluble ligand binding domain-containing protein n=1 Tax=Eiseniibacteriota bacterium TaxID=2212470 RepID=A0A538TBL7_UNCEI|nr:MAG: hypothetical protein E6K76_00050 [Candidatus Eisenbacteria bacterium]